MSNSYYKEANISIILIFKKYIFNHLFKETTNNSENMLCPHWRLVAGSNIFLEFCILLCDMNGLGFHKKKQRRQKKLGVSSVFILFLHKGKSYGLGRILTSHLWGSLVPRSWLRHPISLQIPKLGS